MKLLFVCLLLSLGTRAMAQKTFASRLETRIVDDGKLLSIQIDGLQNGRKIHYQRIFDVANMNHLQKEVLKCQVFYSQGLPLPLQALSGIIITVLSVAALAVGLLVAGYRAWKANRKNTLKTLPG